MKLAWDFWAFLALILVGAISVGKRFGWIAGVAVIGVVAAILAIPLLADAILDPWARSTIRRYFSRRGFTDVRISTNSNHYGVRAERDGVPIYAHCRFVFGRLRWKGEPP